MRAVFTPTTTEELKELKAARPEAAVMAGGTDLLVWMRSGKADPEAIILTEKIQGLSEIREEGNDLIIGASVTFQNIIGSGLIEHHCPVLREAAGRLGSPPIRHMATIGGNICSASPAGDSLPALYLSDAVLVIESLRERRTLSLSEFIRGPGVTSLEKDEILTEIRLKKTRGGMFGFRKIGLRKALAISVASLAWWYRVDEENRVADISLAWGSVGPTVVRIPEVENLLRGTNLGIRTMTEAAHLASERVSPVGDLRASAEYRRTVAGSLLFSLTKMV